MTKNRLIILLLLFWQYSAAQKAPAQLPVLSTIHSIDNPQQKLQNAWPTTGKIVLVFYDPGCGHCQKLGAGIAKHVNDLKNTFVFFIAMQDKEYVDGFVNMFAKELKGKRFISFWKDPGTEFIEKFVPQDYPATYIYDAKSKKLINSFQGQSKIEKLGLFD